MKTLLTTTVLLLAALPVSAAGVDPAVHNLCKEAKDYAGCVRSMTTDVTEQTLKIDQTNRPGLRSELGNSCPAGFAYAGGGQCRSVVCVHGGLFGRNEPQLAGKGHRCPAGMGNYFGYRGSLRWGNSYMPPVNNPNCPQVEPRMGDNSSCSARGLRELTGSADAGDDNWDDPTDYIPE